MRSFLSNGVREPDNVHVFFCTSIQPGLCGIPAWDDRQWCAPVMAIVAGLIGVMTLSLCTVVPAIHLRRKQAIVL